MARLAPKLEIIRALFARSGNQCAFPGCTQPLINEKHKFIGQICHIESALPGGERFNEDQSDEDRRGFDNLILLCYPHHIETDDVDEYPVEYLKQIKFDHEKMFEKSEFVVNEKDLHTISMSMYDYWKKIDKLNSIEHFYEELKFDIDSGSGFFDVLKSAKESLAHIKEFAEYLHKSDSCLEEDFHTMLEMKDIDKSIFGDIPYYENKFSQKNWEAHNLGIPNCLQQLEIDFVHLEIKYLEEYLKLNYDDSGARTRLEEVKNILAEMAQNACRRD